MSSKKEMEMRSSAVTLSDMEMFIFPELIYSLVLANIMSPRIWRWREDPWFEGLEKMKPVRRINRLKQFVMDHYVFNLDLDTWGLTSKESELARFDTFIDADMLAQSNALFGYEGDKYYFDIDIRTHFGLDKYEGSIIPYWKTETVEAMDAFCHKPDYSTGAGECVSLSTLYAAALYVIAGIPLKDIYLMATPLHSQNFIDVGKGVLTNNRRLVTKSMWFNGSAISAQARRALENERVTIVAHETGVVHGVYEEATMDREAYEHFASRLTAYLQTRLGDEVLGNFLRHDDTIWKCFQVRWSSHGHDHYLGLERVFDYEKSSSYRLTDETRSRLMEEIADEECMREPLKSRIILNDLEDFIKDNKIDINNPDDMMRLSGQFASDCLSADIAISSLARFCRVEPMLPVVSEKKFAGGQEPLGLEVGMGREEIIEQLEAVRSDNEMADLAFYAYRDLGRTEPGPYLKASLERNPVSIKASEGLAVAEIEEKIRGMVDESIYDEDCRLAQPDEVWNYGRGDGVEKALLLANILKSRGEKGLSIEVAPDKAILKAGDEVYEFASAKNLKEVVWGEL